MWEKFLDIFVKVITLVQRSDALDKKVNEQEQEIKQLAAIAQRLAFELQRTNDKVENVSVREASEREKLLLKVENQLLKAQRQIPPVPDDNDKAKQ